MKILAIILAVIYFEQLKTMQSLPKVRDKSLTLSDFPLPASPKGAAPSFISNA